MSGISCNLIKELNPETERALIQKNIWGKLIIHLDNQLFYLSDVSQERT